MTRWWILAALLPAALPAQSRPTARRTPPPLTLAVSVAPVTRPAVRPPARLSTPRWPATLPARPVEPRFRSLGIYSFAMSRFDDNVNRDSAGVESWGVISGMGATYQTSAVRPFLVAEYDVAVHRYSATERFNRVSQRMRATMGGRLARWWTMELVTEGSLKGSFEDRDVSDQLAVQPRTEFRLGSARRLRLTASQRWRRYPASPEQDAENRYLAAEFRHRTSDGASWESEFRVEENDALGPRFDYQRTTWNASYLTPLGKRATFEVEMQYRLQKYTGRFVEVEDEDVPRADHRLQPAAVLAYRLGPIDLELSYEPEWRRSNDPTRSIDQNVLLFGMRHRW